ncbi:LysR family transcriptional regulator [Frateuria sp. Soil773]|uniref:LysR family transcriptional regulator n=1 Tax=Frateuria sp. Soil773 TaxID=1736407 RepID=UPI0006FD2DDD|nr:LysR family transcriptional regulator [Frateuria sp. Soil773]KRE89186.1 LysR family transcriptional regulator [Frateuria sp. Soil773]
MELRHLRYFIAVAEERHFTRAAARLGIGQPPLSMQIRQLERELGARLFHRLSRGVELTEAGRRLLERAGPVITQLEQAKAEVAQLARGEAGRLRVGFAGATYFQPRVPALIQDYRQRHPDVELLPEQSNTPALTRGLHAGSIDVAFIRPSAEADEALAVETLVVESMLAVLPRRHPLASGGAAIPLAALAGETFILFPRDIGPGLYDTIAGACHRAGFSPRLGLAAPQIPSIVPMVEAGFGVSIVPASVSRIGGAGVAYLPLAGDAPSALLALAYRRDERSQLVRRFVALARQAAREAAAT